MYLITLSAFVGRLSTHLDEIDFDVSLIATEWFLCLFSKSLPSEVRIPSTNLFLSIVFPVLLSKRFSLQSSEMSIFLAVYKSV